MSTEFPSLADIVRKHRLTMTFRTDTDTGWQCDCGWRSPEKPWCTRTDHPEHVEQMWREARTIHTADQLAVLPRGTVVESAAETIGAHCGDQRGVVFGDDRPFGWQNLALPAVVLRRPTRQIQGEAMTDRDILDRARYALDGITPGPWEAMHHFHDTSYPSDTYHVITERTGDLVAEVDDQTRTLGYEEPHGEFGRDAQFIAAAPALVRELADALEAARDSASHWEGLWRQDIETAATALRDRDQALAEVEQLRGNQRVEVVEGWHGIAKGSD